MAQKTKKKNKNKGFIDANYIRLKIDTTFKITIGSKVNSDREIIHKPMSVRFSPLPLSPLAVARVGGFC